METAIWILHVLTALGVIGFVLLQHGKGADVGAAFGSGASGSLFGSTGSATFLSRTTAVLAAVFFATSLGLGYFSSHRTAKPLGNIVVPVEQTKQTPEKKQEPVTSGGAQSGTPSKAGEIPN